MTGPGNVDNFDDAADETLSSPGAEEKEMERLRQIMRTSRAHLDRAAAVRNGTGSSLDEDQHNDGTNKKKKRKRRSDKDKDDGANAGRGGGGDDDDDDDDDDDNDDNGADPSSTANPNKPKDDTVEDKAEDSIFSPEMQKEMDAIGAGCDDCVILPTKKKKKAAKVVELTPEEIKAARAQHKNAARKLKQLADRKEQKKMRAELYATLRENAISSEERELLTSSSTLGKRVSKKEQLQRLIRKERAGIPLTEEEKDILYTEQKVGGGDDIDDMGNEGAEATTETKIATDASMDPDLSSTVSKKKDDAVDDAKAARQKRKKERRKKRKLEQREKAGQSEVEEAKSQSTNDDAASSDGDEKDTRKGSKAGDEQPEIMTPFPKETSPPPVFNPASFAASMMANLSSLKTTAAADTEALRKKEAAEAEAAEVERLRLEEEERKKRKVYVPSESIIVKTAATLGLQSRAEKSNWRVLPVDRPEEIEEARFDLPVSAMEFEIVDAVRSSDTTIICAETGSGKSTQVVQMLYGESDGLVSPFGGCVTFHYLDDDQHHANSETQNILRTHFNLQLILRDTSLPAEKSISKGLI